MQSAFPSALPAALPTAAELSTYSKEAFVDAVGSVYEKSPWIAERAYEARPFESLSALRDALRAACTAATDEEHVALLRAHPDLAGKAALAGELTAESTEEQRRSGLGSLTEDEMKQFNELNGAYKAKFGFPFILAVRNANKATILASFAARLHNSAHEERSTAIAQVHKIAWMRLRALVSPNPTGFLTCHALDTARGCPAAGMTIELRRLDEASGAWQPLASFVTNADGRLTGGPALKGAAFTVGTYEWTFGVGDYFAAAGVPISGTPFLADVPLRFGIDDPEAHYHVPLLCSPWSYSTYRGS
ncbi:ohcu decarboxylase [Chrysochromulina tobinii]|uniref:Parahox neighbor n=1 Tax=Chrysochromulina tobinii TaxID=1460289 RepID=A0A0M0JEN2_9EUKA|nr:ohcu decarboxylase [Chrysochromulina tobinii]|eukprot:KOO25041.1 ohcu decarboxylase [Chrysochromulina sp. CCMP291]